MTPNPVSAPTLYVGLDIAKAILKESYDKEQLVRFGASTRF